jgi:hypothetical protein
VHGAVALELKGLVITPDAEASYREFMDTVIRGLAPDYSKSMAKPSL